MEKQKVEKEKKDKDKEARKEVVKERKENNIFRKAANSTKCTCVLCAAPKVYYHYLECTKCARRGCGKCHMLKGWRNQEAKTKDFLCGKC